MNTKITREQPATKEFRKRVLSIMGTGQISAYDVATAMQKRDDSVPWAKLYKKVLYHFRNMEASDKIEFVCEKQGSGPIPKRLYKRRVK